MSKIPVRKLTAKQALFVKEYLIDLNATQAAIRAGYSERTARSQGQRLLTKDDIKKAIAEAQSERKAKLELSAESVIENILLVQQDAMRVGKDMYGNEKMINHSAALKAGELLGKHLGILSDKIEHSGSIQVNSTVTFVDAPKYDDED